MTLLVPQIDGVPTPRPTAISQPYWDGIAASELRFQRCNTCERAVTGPASACSHCQATTLRWERSAGVGELYSWTVVHRPPTPAFVAPYAPAIVRLAEGFDMVSAIVGCDHTELRASLPVQVTFAALTGRREGKIPAQLPFFEAASVGTAPGGRRQRAAKMDFSAQP